MTEPTIDSAVGRDAAESSAALPDQPPWLELRDKYKLRIYWYAYMTPFIVAMGFVLGRRFVKVAGYQANWFWMTVYLNAMSGPTIVAFMIATDREFRGFIEKLVTFILSGFFFCLIYSLAFGLAVKADLFFR